MKSGRTTSRGEGRVVDFMIAGSLATFPLLPAGPTFLGRDWPWALEAFFLAVLVLGGVFVAAHRSYRAGAESVRLVRRGYLVWLVPVMAAALVGLLEKNPLDSVLLGVETDDLIGRLARPMDQAVDPFYPLRVGLTYLEGALAFWLFSSMLTRARRPGRRIQAALTGCLVGVVLVSTVALVQYFTRANLLTYWVRANPDLTRSNGTLDDPNALASFLVLGIGLAAGVLWSRHGWAGRWPRLVAMLTAVLACAALVTTVSRSGWAALLIAGVMCAAAAPDELFDSKRLARVTRLVARSAVVLLLGSLVFWAIALVATPKRTTSLPATPWQAVVQTVDPRESLDVVLRGRLLLWRAAIDLARANLPLGAGLGLFPSFAATYPDSAGPENAHNYFLQVLAESGVAGLAGLSALLATIAVALRYRVRERRRHRGRLALGLSVGLLAFVLTWLTGHPMLNLSNQLWLACVLAVGLAAVEPAVPAAPASSGTAVLRVWLLGPALAAAAVVITLIAVTPRVVAKTRAGWVASHAAGVYAWEQMQEGEETRFRWTKGHAAFREPVLARLLTIPIDVARPNLAEQPVQLRVTVGDVLIEPVMLTKNGWQMQTYDLAALLGESAWQSHRTITLKFEVRPVFVPAEAGPSDDRRELGVRVGTFKWSWPGPQSGTAGKRPS